MKKFFKVTLIIFVSIGIIGYGLYYYVKNIVSENLTEIVSSKLEDGAQLEEIKDYIESDAELKEFLMEAESVDQETLPFSTKEEGIKTIVQKVGLSELTNIQEKAQTGTLTQEEILQILDENFTEEEIAALKAIAYKEIYK
jgi:hypothetical protein